MVNEVKINVNSVIKRSQKAFDSLVFSAILECYSKVLVVNARLIEAAFTVYIQTIVQFCRPRFELDHNWLHNKQKYVASAFLNRYYWFSWLLRSYSTIRTYFDATRCWHQ